ncbi:MAG: Fe-S cluster assembly protein SufD [Acidimicrobiales bacterium]
MSGARTGFGLATAGRAGPSAGEPAWLVGAREGATGWLARNDFPTRKDEDWRYCRLDPILELPFEPPLVGMVAATFDRPEVEAALPEGFGGARLVFVNGRFEEGLSRTGGLPEAVYAGSLVPVLSDRGGRLRSLWPHLAGYPHAFRALNDALAVDGAFVDLPAGATVEAPIEVVCISVPGEHPVMSNPRSIVRAGAGARATIVETYLGLPGGPCLTNAHTQIVLGDGARVDHYKFQDEDPKSYHLSCVEVRPGQRARFSSRLVALGGRIARHEVNARLEEEQATVDLDGLYLPSGEQYHDNPVRVEHAARRCTSRQVYKGIVDGSAHGVFNGHVIVRPGADGTDAHQVNKNLLLSDRAEVDTRPRLEIFADDVACTHGAAVGSLDPDAMFYLRSRGIPHPQARALLVAGFAQEVLDRFPAGAVRDRAERLVGGRLARVPAAKEGWR